MPIHHMKVSASQSVPPELDAGAEILMNVEVSCSEGCDLRGPIQIVAEEEVLVTRELVPRHGATNETGDITLTAPQQIGEHVWTVVFPRHDEDGVVHEESRLAITFTTRPHATSMAVWDVPSPLVVNAPFKVKVGVKCAAACQLAGWLIEVYDEAGIRLGEGRLGETPWPGTSALHVSEVELTGPAIEGIRSWSARFAAPESGLPHEEACAIFSFKTARPPEYCVTVRVTEPNTHAPLDRVDVRLGPYRASTDAHGLASLELPSGAYEVNAWKAGYEVSPRTVEVTGDLVIQLDAKVALERDPDEQRVWM
jgi:hypothetical protein